MHKHQTIKLTIDNIGHNGEGIGRYEGLTVFVEGALPGEEVSAQIVERRKKFARAEMLSIQKPSTKRVPPTCSLFGKCGGCQLMHLAYAEQLVFKRQRVVDALERIGKFVNPAVADCTASPKSEAYRNKIQLPVRQLDGKMVVGYFARSSHELVEVATCHIHNCVGEQVYQEIIPILKKSKIVPYDPVTGTGELRHLIIKSAVNANEVLVVLVTTSECSQELSNVAQKISSHCTAVKGVIRNINDSRDNVILGDKYEVLVGQDFIQERINGIYFKVSPASFFQVNPEQAEVLYAKAIELACLNGQEIVLDAFCGVGTLTLLMARHALSVIGVDCVPDAVKDARENALLNRIENVEFICAEAEKWIYDLEAIDVVLLNPPRKGCEVGLLEALGKLKPRTIVYISCDPATLARDLAHLHTYGYVIDSVQPFDMFPQTAHVETIVKCTRSVPDCSV